MCFSLPGREKYKNDDFQENVFKHLK